MTETEAERWHEWWAYLVARQTTNEDNLRRWAEQQEENR